MRARQEAGGRRQEKNNYSIKTGFGMMLSADQSLYLLQ
jgi:hypothetical protein